MSRLIHPPLRRCNVSCKRLIMLPCTWRWRWSVILLILGASSDSTTLFSPQCIVQLSSTVPFSHPLSCIFGGSRMAACGRQHFIFCRPDGALSCLLWKLMWTLYSRRVHEIARGVSTVSDIWYTSWAGLKAVSGLARPVYAQSWELNYEIWYDGGLVYNKKSYFRTLRFFFRDLWAIITFPLAWKWP